MNIFDKIYKSFNPDAHPDISFAFEYSEEHLPTLWLLGKAGAGKSSLVQRLTGLDEVEIGNGFQPCTKTAFRYIFPQEKPLMSFLDTRGLSEAGYDPQEDITACLDGSHALLVVMRANDPIQVDVLNALKQIKNSKKIKHAILVQTETGSLEDPDTQRSLEYQKEKVEKVWGAIESVVLNPETADNIATLIDHLRAILPIVSELFVRNKNSTQEEENFQKMKAEIMWYAAAAGTTDAVPIIGLVSVPSIQAKMLHSLANQYGLEWNKKLFTEFLGAMGTSFAVQYASRLSIQQLTKMIPVYGQTVGAASAATLSACYTYALGRVSCLYFYRKQAGEPVTTDELKKQFNQAFSMASPNQGGSDEA